MLITDNTKKVFDVTKIQKDDLIRAQYHSWPEAKNGIITDIKENKLTVLSLANVGNATNYYVILASEVESHKWAVKWTNDFSIINSEGMLL